MWLLNWHAEENLVVNNKDNRHFFCFLFLIWRVKVQSCKTPTLREFKHGHCLKHNFSRPLPQSYFFLAAALLIILTAIEEVATWIEKGFKTKKVEQKSYFYYCWTIPLNYNLIWSSWCVSYMNNNLHLTQACPPILCSKKQELGS